MQNDGKNILNLYFGALIFQKIESENSQNSNYATYVAKIKTFLVSLTDRYIITFVPITDSHLQKGKLKELGWINLQVRSLPKNAYNVNSQDWTAPVMSKSIPALFFKLKERNERWSIYGLDTQNSEALFNFDVRLLHKKSKKTIYQYPNNMNFHQIVDQFETIFDMIQLPPNNLFYDESNYNQNQNYDPLFHSLNENIINYSQPEIINSNFELV
jgi:hypothetical protein